ncbi:MAG: TonB family protein [Deltaproteobacteria bacterium]|nr:TonB family protein [Deltaproteobacteria bacterium]
MKGNRRNSTCAIALGVLALWAGGPVCAQTEAEADLHPPHLVDSPPPQFPPGREGEGLHPTVVLLVTITGDAKVTDIVVEHSAGPDFDAAAVEAVQIWTFEPATKGGAPVASRIRIAVHFEEPEVGVHDDTGAYAGAAASTDADADADAGTGTGTDTGTDADADAGTYRTDARVGAERLRSAGRGAADFEIDQDILNAAPVFSAKDLLKRVPGLYASQPEGGAVGERFFLRGFDSEHGQDIEFKVGDIPINQPSHIHGQGYTYQGFIIPEVVRQLRVTEGVYDPVQGDFAIAGTIDYELGVERRGVYAKTDLGSFRTFRQIAIFAPEGSDADTFGAFQLRRTDGFGENRDGIDGSAMFQYGFGREHWRFRVRGAFAGAHYNTAGVLRSDDIEAGDIAWSDVYPFDTARAQNGSNLGTILGFSGEHRGENKRNSSFGLWLQFHDFRLKENFTGFLRTDANGDTPGDLIEQLDRRFVIGGNARHRTRQFAPADRAKGTIELGLSGRVDLIEQELDLVEAPQNRVYEERIDADIAETDIGMWLDLDWDFTRYLNITGGVRADVLFYNVTDRQESVSPEGVVPYRRTAAGVAVGPRTAVTVKPIEELDVVLAYGQGFRSPQARVLIENEDVPFTKVHSVDIGLRSRAGENDEFKLALTGFFTKMNNDLIFEAHEARFEPVGPTTRIGAVFYTQARPLPWLYGAFSVTYVRATLDETPPPEPGEPPSGLQAGDPIPFVPPWLLRLDLGASEDLVDLGKHALHGKLGFGYTFLSERPLSRFPSLQPARHPIRRAGVRVRIQLEPQRAANWPARKTHRRRRPENIPLPDRFPPLMLALARALL